MPTATVSGIAGGAGSEKPGEPVGPRSAVTVQSEYPTERRKKVLLDLIAVLTWPKSSVPGESERMHCTPSPESVKWLACGSLVAGGSRLSHPPPASGENSRLS